MTNTVLIKRSSVANSVPLAGNLQPGELAINYNDGNLFYKNTSNVVTVIASNKFVSVSGNVTGGNIITSGAVSTSGIVGTGDIDFVSSGNISLGNVGNVHISGGSAGYVLSTNGSGNLSWVAQTGGGGAASVITVDDFTGNGVQTQFPLSVTPSSIDNTTVNYNGVIQLRTSYTLSGANVVFSSAPAANSSIEVTTISPVLAGAAGNSTQVQYNTGGNLDASNAFTFDSASNVLSVVGNISGTYFIGNGSLLTGISAGSSYSNANVAAYLASGTDTSNIITTGNIAGGNISTAGMISATGNITGGNILGGANVNATTHTGTTVSVSANVTGGNILTGGVISATGTVTGSSVLGSVVSASANITGGNVLTAGIVSAAGAGIFGGGLSVTGNITATGNINYQNITDLIVGDPLIYIGANNTSDLVDLGLVASANVAGTYQHLGIVRDHNTGTWRFFSNVVAEPTTVIDWANSVYAPMSAGAITSNSTVSASGNITGGNLSGTSIAGTLTTAAQNNITSVGTLSSLSVTANVAGGNLRTAGLITATGNITGANLSLSYGLISASGMVYDPANVLLTIGGPGPANVRIDGLGGVYAGTGRQISAVGNVTGGNINTGGLVTATGNITSAGNVAATYFIGNGSQLTGITSTVSPAGSNTQIQFNDTSALGASANLTFDKTTNTLNATNVTANGVPLATTGKAIAMAIVFGF
jgi:hypothetical protein